MDHQFNVTVVNMAGDRLQLPPLLGTGKVQDLAFSVRKHAGIPLCAMKLLKDAEILTDLSMPLTDVFGAFDHEQATKDIELMVVRRQLSEGEVAELDRGLVRSAAEGKIEAMQEYLVEGAKVDPEKNPCGGVSAFMVALASGDERLCEKLRQVGAAESDMVPTTNSIQEAFTSNNFVEVLRRISAGDSVNAKLSRGQGVQASSSGTPLHACCAMHKIPGATEVAQLLIRKRADLAAGDAEGDTPLAHAKYFCANELFQILESNGAELGGPFYQYRFFGRD